MKNSIILKQKFTAADRSFELFLNGKHVDNVRSYKITGGYDDITEITITLLVGEIKMLIEGNATKGFHSSLRKFIIRCKAFIRRRWIKIY